MESDQRLSGRELVSESQMNSMSFSWGTICCRQKRRWRTLFGTANGSIGNAEALRSGSRPSGLSRNLVAARRSVCSSRRLFRLPFRLRFRRPFRLRYRLQFGVCTIESEPENIYKLIKLNKARISIEPRIEPSIELPIELALEERCVSWDKHIRRILKCGSALGYQ